MTDELTPYERAAQLLAERGVNDAFGLLAPFGDDLDPVLGAIASWDRAKDAGVGLLVHKIRQGGSPGYKPPHKRTAAHNGEVTRGKRSADEWYAIYRRNLCAPGDHPVADMCWTDTECRQMADERAGQRW